MTTEDMMTGYTNSDRASAASEAMSRYAEAKGIADGVEDDETILGDLLCDLRHLADARGLDIEKLWRRAEMNHAAEVSEELPAERDGMGNRIDGEGELTGQES